MSSKTQINTIYYQGLMLIGEVTKTHGQLLMNNPLTIVPDSKNPGQLLLAPFGFGFFKSPLKIPNDVIISKTTDEGIKDYIKAVIEINEKQKNNLKNSEQVLNEVNN